ncbi:unnamed protein product [Schistosoma mattheei]|uniref:Uncharacterized protein n=1 Tax=Schistosoma mattheei TaxID=31246 RepID=A0A3P8ELJ6_9TREM|nr:unnamed protein product [Schistosoma mattheei]
MMIFMCKICSFFICLSECSTNLVFNSSNELLLGL